MVWARVIGVDSEVKFFIHGGFYLTLHCNIRWDLSQLGAATQTHVILLLSSFRPGDHVLTAKSGSV